MHVCDTLKMEHQGQRMTGDNTGCVCGEKKHERDKTRERECVCERGKTRGTPRVILYD